MKLPGIRQVIPAVIGVLTVVLWPPTALAHDARPAYLEVSEHPGGVLEVDWTRPVRNGRALNIHTLFPRDCDQASQLQQLELQGVRHESWKLDCAANGMSGQLIEIRGLENVISDVLLRYRFASGGEVLRVLNKNNPLFVIDEQAGDSTPVTGYYFNLGVEHILSGPDHLLFVLGLLLLLPGLWRLFKTITAFTLAHSLTLAAAILGYVQVPSAPVEAIIALSIIFVARELLRGESTGLSARTPWLIAAVFGLVHGLGFAGGLREIGLPEGEIPMALLMFNLGVEAGQLGFIAVALLFFRVLRKITAMRPDWLEKVCAYGIGSIAGFWLVERLTGFYA